MNTSSPSSSSTSSSSTLSEKDRNSNSNSTHNNNNSNNNNNNNDNTVSIATPTPLSSSVVYIGLIDRKAEVYREGDEAEKVVSFYPCSTPVETIANVAGLAEALATFASIFNPPRPRPPPPPPSSSSSSSAATRPYPDGDRDDTDVNSGGTSDNDIGNDNDNDNDNENNIGNNNSLAHAMSCDLQRHIFVSSPPEHDYAEGDAEGDEEEGGGEFLCFCVLSNELSASHAPTWALRRALKEALRTVRRVLGGFRAVLDEDKRRILSSLATGGYDEGDGGGAVHHQRSLGSALRQRSALSCALSAFVVPMMERSSVAMATGLSGVDGASREVHAAVRAAVLGNGFGGGGGGSSSGGGRVAAQRVVADVQRRMSGLSAATGAVAGMVVGMGGSGGGGGSAIGSVKEVWSTLSDDDSAMVMRFVEGVLAPATGFGGGFGGSGGSPYSVTGGGGSGIMNRMRKKSSFIPRRDSRRANLASRKSQSGKNDNNVVTSEVYQSQGPSSQIISPQSHESSASASSAFGGQSNKRSALSFCPFSRNHWKRRSSWIDVLTLSYDLDFDRAGHLPIIWIDDGRADFGCEGVAIQITNANDKKTGMKMKSRRRVVMLPCVGKEVMLILFLPVPRHETVAYCNIDQEVLGRAKKYDTACNKESDSKVTQDQAKADNNGVAEAEADAKAKAKAKGKFKERMGPAQSVSEYDNNRMYGKLKQNQHREQIDDNVIEYIGISSLQDTSIVTAVREMHSLETLLSSAQSQLRLSRDEQNGHVTGYRYLYRNSENSRGLGNASGFAISSPIQKVSKMSVASVAVVRGIREQFSCNKFFESDNETSTISANDGPDKECDNQITQESDHKFALGEDAHYHSKTGDVEIFVRTANDAWVILRRFGPRELIVVLERAGETLLEAAAAVKYFAERYFRGMEIRE